LEQLLSAALTGEIGTMAVATNLKGMILGCKVAVGIMRGNNVIVI